MTSSTGYSGALKFSSSTGTFEVHNMVLEPSSNAYGVQVSANTTTVTCVNAIVIGDSAYRGFLAAATGDVLNLYNCIAVGCSQPVQCNNAGATVTATNCYVDGSYLNSGGGTLTLTTSASSDTTGSEGLQNVVYSTTNFTNVTSGSEDFHLVDGSVLINSGTATSYTTDYEGTSWGTLYDIGVYAYSSVSLTVTYDGNGNDGGTAPTDSTSYSDGDTVTVLGNTGSLTLTDYVWGGWNTASDGSGTSYVESDTFTISADVTLYALWVTTTISGFTYNKSQEVEPSVTLSLFSTTGSGVYAYVDTTTSDATTGAFSFTLADTTLDYLVIAYLDGSPDTFDVSANDLYSGDTVSLYLRSQTDKTASTGTGAIFSLASNGGYDG